MQEVVGYGIRRSGDDGFIIPMAAFIGALNICKLKLTYEIQPKSVLTDLSKLIYQG